MLPKDLELPVKMLVQEASDLDYVLYNETKNEDGTRTETIHDKETGKLVLTTTFPKDVVETDEFKAEVLLKLIIALTKFYIPEEGEENV